MPHSKNNRLILLALGLFVFNAFTWTTIANFQQLRPRTIFLDVGQGHGVLLTNSRTAIVVDTGPSGFRTATAMAKHLPGFRQRLDLIFLSHADRDHYGGTLELLKRYSVGAVIINPVKNQEAGWLELLEALDRRQIPVITARAGTEISTPHENISVLHPPAKTLFAPKKSGKKLDYDNPNSLVLLVKQKFKTASTSILLTGDIDGRVEANLIQQVDLRADYLQAPHHGSRFSSSQAFLRAAQPCGVIIQVGRNRYGHPHPTVLNRIRQQGLTYWRTDLDGELVLPISNLSCQRLNVSR